MFLEKSLLSLGFFDALVRLSATSSQRKISVRHLNFCSKRFQAAWEYGREHTDHLSSGESVQVKKNSYKFAKCYPPWAVMLVFVGVIRWNLGLLVAQVLLGLHKEVRKFCHWLSCQRFLKTIFFGWFSFFQ